MYVSIYTTSIPTIILLQIHYPATTDWFNGRATGQIAFQALRGEKFLGRFRIFEVKVFTFQYFEM